MPDEGGNVMKKAIVIAFTMMLGLGLTAFAGPLSGSWASDLVVDPAASSFTSLSSTLAVDYTVSGWTFGSSSSFTLSGFSSQSFTAGGSFGAFTLSSTMTFNPMFVTVKTYDYGTLFVIGDLFFEIEDLLFEMEDFFFQVDLILQLVCILS